MKLGFLNDVNEYGDQVIRLYNFDKAEAILFRDAVQKTVIDASQSLDLSSLSFIEHTNCKLILHISETDEGILTMDNQTFFCDLTMEGYKNMIQLIEPFCIKESKSFKMLYDIDTQVDFLFSPYGN
ncbi:hypothetical protein BH10BAC1_BH10BAC1_18420 [soil metagenome]